MFVPDQIFQNCFEQNNKYHLPSLLTFKEHSLVHWRGWSERKTNNTMVLRKKAQNSFDVALFIIRECCRHIRKIPYMVFVHKFEF